MGSLRHCCIAVLLGLLTLSGAAEGNAAPRVIFETSAGNFEAELFPEEAPVTVDNFLDYVDAGFFDGLIFHRVIANFMIQTGGYTPDLRLRDPRSNIINESVGGPSNQRGTLSMARRDYPHSANSQFFINVRDNQRLDAQRSRPGYAVFGRITAGMEVVDAISVVETGVRDRMADVPLENVVIHRVRRADSN
ncbi:MAG: peptidylprolyl isomerase [Gammaproteobacteria bacterium]|nr:peptidylprolyl isomerase [Gammaproteobacteria bacterium]